MSKASIFWFTGLSGSGKTTIAKGAKILLKKNGYKSLILDGDIIRSKLHSELGFSKEDIIKNNSLIKDMCIKERSNYNVLLIPIISPYRISREQARLSLSPRFYEIFVRTNKNILMKRDTKGLYAKAIKGELNNLIGFSPNAPFEKPLTPDLIIDSSKQSKDSSIELFYNFVLKCQRT